MVLDVGGGADDELGVSSEQDSSSLMLLCLPRGLVYRGTGLFAET
jgi:hypothetical protein